jgi:RNase adapter protein RapZ
MSEIQSKVLIVTGLSGAGKTQALKILKELGYNTVDNLPLPLLNAFLSFEKSVGAMPCALGVDVRTRGFRPEGILQWLYKRQQVHKHSTQLLFLDCSDEVLARRYTETRSVHPLATHESPTSGIHRERLLLAPLREVADAVLDTSRYSLVDLKKHLSHLFGAPTQAQLVVSLWSFGYKKGIPQSADIILDARFLRNPHWDETLRPLTGQQQSVKQYIAADPNYAPFMRRIIDVIQFMMAATLQEGRGHLGIAIGCTGGKHRSVAIVEALAQSLRTSMLNTPHVVLNVLHRDLMEHDQ